MKKIILLFIILNAMSTHAQSVGGTLSSSDTAKCVTANSGIINLTGQNGNVIRWEYSYSGGDPWTPIAVTSPFYNFTNLSQSISYRAVVQQPSFLPVYSSIIRINVYPATVTGSLSGPTEVCSGIPVAYQLSGNVGEINFWQVSTNNGSSWTNIPNSADSTQKVLTATQNSWYRANITSGACLTLNTPILQVTNFSTTVAGSIIGTDSICGTSNSVNLSVSGATTTSYSWEVASSNSGPWSLTTETGISALFLNQPTTTFYRVKTKNGGCNSVYTPVKQVTFSQPSVGGSVSSVSSICANDSFSLTAVNYTGTIQNWQYRLQGSPTWISMGTNATVTNFSLSTSGVYEFSFVVKSGSCSSAQSLVKLITVNTLPLVSFSINPTCEDVNASFVNSTTGTNTYVWDFGNGNSSNLVNPQTIYSNSGTYSVKLTATSAFGCVDSLRQNATIYQKPSVGFNFADSLCFADQVNFTNTSNAGQGTISTIEWKDNGSLFSSLLNPSYLFPTEGNHTVRLIILNSVGCSHYLDTSLQIYSKPTADFTFSNACFGEEIDFSNESTINSGSMSYAWNFGDGNTSILSNPNHSFSSTGSFNVMLQVSSNFGCSDTLIKALTVNPSPVVDFSATSVCKIDSMVFVPSISGVSNYTSAWTFGDGTNSSLDTPSHLYSSYGTYSVNLTITTDSACSAQLTKNVQVFPMPVAQFSVANICEDYAAQVENFSSIGDGTFISEWSFNNGALIAANEPSQVFTSAGTFPILLIVTSNNGCIDSLQQNIVVNDSPVADFSFINTCNGTPIQFTNESTVNSGSIASFDWNFGDNTNSTLENPTKDYLNFGDYSVQLIVTSTNGCIDSVSQIATSNEQPIANFGVGNVCFGEETVFDNQTLLSLGTYQSTWDFDDFSSSTIVSPSHTYSDAGVFLVKLHVLSDQGCEDSIVKPVTVYFLPLVNAGTDTTISKGFTIELNGTGAAEYTWGPSYGLDNPQIANPNASPDSTMTYVLIGESAFGCIAQDTVVVTVEETFKVFPFNVLTPDGNSKNDTWIIEYIESYPNNEVVILNELGHEVFTMKGYNNSWDGKNKTGEILPDGTYYYVLKFEGSTIEYQGDILLLRNL
jgi:gliding motility-associated-like protein